MTLFSHLAPSANSKGNPKSGIADFETNLGLEKMDPQVRVETFQFLVAR